MLSYAYRGAAFCRARAREGPAGARLRVFFWLAEEKPTRRDWLGREDGIAAYYWLEDGLSFAVMGSEENPDLEDAAKTVFSFYDASLSPD